MAIAEAEKLYSPIQVAELWGCSRSHIYDLISAGKLTVADIGIEGTKTRIAASELTRFVEQHSRRPRSAPVTTHPARRGP